MVLLPRYCSASRSRLQPTRRKSQQLQGNYPMLRRRHEALVCQDFNCFGTHGDRLQQGAAPGGVMREAQKSENNGGP